MLKRVFFWFAAASFIYQPFAAGADGGIAHMVRHKDVIKAYIKAFVNQSGQQISPDDFRKIFEKALLNRRAVKFEVVNNQESSDVLISGIIKKYLYLEKGPLKFSPSLQSMVLDAAATATQNYVEMTVEFAVIETKTGRLLWKDEIDDYIKQVMTPAESIPLIYDRVSRVFLWKSFGKRK